MIVYDFLKFAWLEQCVFETLNLNVYRLDMQTEQANTIFSKMEKPDKPLKFHFLGSFRLQYRRWSIIKWRMLRILINWNIFNQVNILLKQKHRLDHNFRWKTCILLGCNNLFVLFESNNIYFCVNCKYFFNTVLCFSHPIWGEREMLREFGEKENICYENELIKIFSLSLILNEYKRNMNLGFTTWLNA